MGVALFLGIAAGALIAASLASARAQASRSTIIVVLKSTNPDMEFWKIVRAGIEVAAKEWGVRPQIVGPWLEKDIDDQVRIMREVVRQRPRGILLAASDYSALVPLARQARAAGIKLVTIDSGVASSAPESFIATDNIQAGRKAGRELGRIVPPGAKVAIVSHIQEVATAIDRERGFREALAETNPTATIVGRYFAFNDYDVAYGITRRLLREHPDLAGIVALNETTTRAAANGVVDAGYGGRVKIVGFDSAVDEIKRLEDGTIEALVVQKPFNMGYVGIQTIVELFYGERVAKFIDTGSNLIRRDTMYTTENEKLLFPFMQTR
ncbi:MAG TPA: substrate-binding domain-containing protein [Spirochaetia bacterium]|nr:substrate-binding domain-containing protein [Spirochaetia bacterium]